MAELLSRVYTLDESQQRARHQFNIFGIETINEDSEALSWSFLRVFNQISQGQEDSCFLLGRGKNQRQVTRGHSLLLYISIKCKEQLFRPVGKFQASLLLLLFSSHWENLFLLPLLIAVLVLVSRLCYVLLWYGKEIRLGNVMST